MSKYESSRVFKIYLRNDKKGILQFIQSKIVLTLCRYLVTIYSRIPAISLHILRIKDTLKTHMHVHNFVFD